jgi:opacity protein-like surface antigen
MKGGHLNKQKFILSLVLLLILSGVIFSQDVKNNSAPDPAEKIYSIGIQYYIVNGIKFAFKFNNQFPTVWRLKIDLSGNIDNSSSFYENYNHDNDLISEYEQKSDNQNYKITMSFECNYFFTVHKRFKPYIGIGPLFSYSSSDGKYEYNSDTDGSFAQNIESNSHSYGIGLIAVGGIESELVDFISLFLEYNLSYIYNFTRNETSEYLSLNDLHNRQKRSTHQYRLQLNTVNIGIIVFL